MNDSNCCAGSSLRRVGGRGGDLLSAGVRLYVNCEIEELKRRAQDVERRLRGLAKPARICGLPGMAPLSGGAFFVPAVADLAGAAVRAGRNVNSPLE
jgi:hypothetical protein